MSISGSLWGAVSSNYSNLQEGSSCFAPVSSPSSDLSFELCLFSVAFVLPKCFSCLLHLGEEVALRVG